MSAGKKRQTMAKQARERAVREKRTLKAERKEERKREAAERGLAGQDETSAVPAADGAVHGLRLVKDEESVPSETTAEPGPTSVELDEGELRGAHA